MATRRVGRRRVRGRAVVLAAALTTSIACSVVPSASVGAAGSPTADAPSADAPAAVVPAGARYVALGSSFASGLGLEPVVDAGCGRSGANYAHEVTSDLRLDLVDVSCAGARTENVEYAPQQAEGTRPAQLDAVNPETALVTLTVGGNDVGYPRVLDDQACSTRSQCPGISPDEDGVLRELDTLDDKLVNTLYAITTKAPNATVLLVSYPQILPSSGETCDAVALTPDQARFSAAAAQQLDGAFRAAAERSGVRLVDSYRASEGHTACAPGEAWVSGYVPDGTPGGPAAFHPTAAGMRAQADLIITALRG